MANGGGLELPIMPVRQTFAPNTMLPKDLTDLIAAFQDDYHSSFMKAREMENERIVGNSEANAAAMKNRAGYEKSSQDVVDQKGRKPPPAPKGGTAGTGTGTGASGPPNKNMSFDWSAYSTPELMGFLEGSL